MLSKSQLDKYMISLICGIQNMTQMNIFKSQKQAHKPKTNLSLPKGNSEEGGVH